MISRILLPLAVLPLLALLFFGGISFYSYNKTLQTFNERADQYNRLNAAKLKLATLEPLVPELERVKHDLSLVNNANSSNEAKNYLYQEAESTEGLKLETSNKTAVQENATSYGNLSLKFICRSETISNYMAEAMNRFPNMVLTSWDISPITIEASAKAKEKSKLLQLNATVTLLKLN